MFLGELRNISSCGHQDRGTYVMFLDHVAPRNIRAYVPQGTKKHNQAYVPRDTPRNISPLCSSRNPKEHKSHIFF
jgi:hypothetical protein